jgi:hypothetical protein
VGASAGARTIRRIVVTADILRPMPGMAGRPATQANGRWLASLLAWPLARACALPVQTVAWGNGFDVAAFYRCLGALPALDDWARLHYQTELPAEADAMVAEAFADSLVIGCELTPSLAASMSRAGIPVIDTVGTPLRFLDDVLNAWRSNHAGVQQRIEAQRFDTDEAHRQAGLLCAKMAWLPAPQDLRPDTALLVGQVGSDKALIHKTEGRLLSFADYVEALFQVAERHAAVLYKPHPYADGHGPSEQVVGRFASFGRTQTNVYRLLAQPELSAVYAISSGCVVEAGYFGKQGAHFYEPLHAFDGGGVDPHGLHRAVPVGQAWLEPAFWREILAPLVEVVPGHSSAPPFRAHRLRRSLNADWNFLEVDDVVMRAASR